MQTKRFIALFVILVLGSIVIGAVCAFLGSILHAGAVFAFIGGALVLVFVLSPGIYLRTKRRRERT